MKTAKSKAKQSDDRRTVEEARRAFSESAKAITATYVFRLRHRWEAVAINHETVDALHDAGKSWNEIGAMLGPACGFPEIPGHTVRVYRSRLKGDVYDAHLHRLGLKREGKILLPLEVEGEQRGEEEASDRLPVTSAAAQGGSKADGSEGRASKASDSLTDLEATDSGRETNAGGHASERDAAAEVPVRSSRASSQPKPATTETNATIRLKEDPE